MKVARALIVLSLLVARPAAAQMAAPGLASGGGVALYGERANAWGAARAVPAVRLALGEHFATRTAPWLVSGHTRHSLRWLGGGRLSLSREEVASGVLRSGPLGVGAFAGAMTFTVDHLADGWSFGLLSPRAGAFVEARVARATFVALALELEYQWRWFGEDQRFVSLGVALYTEARGTRRRR